MELDKFLLGLLVFTAIVIGGVLIIGNSNENYHEYMSNNISTSDYAELQNNTNALYDMSQDMKDSTFGGELDEDATEDSMYKGGYKTIRFISSSFSLVGNIIEAIAIKIGIPQVFITLALAALTISIIFGIVMIIFRIARG